MCICGLTFPHKDDAQLSSAHVADCARVAAPIGFKFLRPELPISLRNSCPRTSSMLVPKTAVDKDHPPACSVGKVGRTWERPDVQTIIQPKIAKNGRNAPLCLRPALSHTGHESTSSWISRQVSYSCRPAHSLCRCLFDSISSFLKNLVPKPCSP